MGQRTMPIHLRLVARALPYRRLLLVAVFVLTASSVLTLATPWLIGYAIDTGLDIRGTGGGETIAQGSMNTLLFRRRTDHRLGASAWRLRLRADVRERADSRRRSHSISATISTTACNASPTPTTTPPKSGRIMSRATQDVEGVRFFVSMGVLRFLFIIVLVTTAYALMITTNLKVGLVALTFVPLVAIQASITSLMLRPIWMQVQDLQGPDVECAAGEPDRPTRRQGLLPRRVRAAEVRREGRPAV